MNLIIAGLIALALHIVLIMPLTVTSEPEVTFKKGESGLKMHLVPSVVSTASTKSIDDIQKEDHKEEEKKIDNPEPVKKPEIPKKEQIKVEEKIVQKVEQEGQEISYSIDYFKAQKEISNKKSQVQKGDTTAIDSKKIIADIREKGVTTGASIKNVIKPRYPSSCKQRAHEGTTVLEVTILSSGKCGNINIIKSASCKSLDKAAIKAIKKSAFRPAMRLGLPITTTKKIAFSFKLEDYQ